MILVNWINSKRRTCLNRNNRWVKENFHSYCHWPNIQMKMNLNRVVDQNVDHLTNEKSYWIDQWHCFGFFFKILPLLADDRWYGESPICKSSPPALPAETAPFKIYTKIFLCQWAHTYTRSQSPCSLLFRSLSPSLFLIHFSVSIKCLMYMM